jgi:hypothetical protein
LELEIVPLTRDHKVNSFNCGEDEIDRHLKWEAFRHIEANLGTTHVAVDPTDSLVVHGFYSCRVSALGPDAKPSGLKKLKGEAMPIVAVTHFGVQTSLQRHRIGERMLFDLYRRAQIISMHVGCHAVCLQALNDNVVKFYERYDMKPYGLNDKNLWIPLSTIKELGLL